MFWFQQEEEGVSVSEVRRTVGVQVGMGMKSKLRGELSFTRLLDIDM